MLSPASPQDVPLRSRRHVHSRVRGLARHLLANTKCQHHAGCCFWHAFTVKLMAEMERLPTVPSKIQPSCPVSGAFYALRGRASKLIPAPNVSPGEAAVPIKMSPKRTSRKADLRASVKSLHPDRRVQALLGEDCKLSRLRTPLTGLQICSLQIPGKTRNSKLLAFFPTRPMFAADSL